MGELTAISLEYNNIYFLNLFAVSFSRSFSFLLGRRARCFTFICNLYEIQIAINFEMTDHQIQSFTIAITIFIQ